MTDKSFSEMARSFKKWAEILEMLGASEPVPEVVPVIPPPPPVVEAPPPPPVVPVEAPNPVQVEIVSMPPVVAPVPVVEPPVAVQIPPAGVFTRPDVVENMFEESPGVWKSRDVWRSTVAALQFKLPALTYGQGVSVSFMRKANYPLTENVKLLRVWLGKIPSYPNFYAGTQVSGGFIWNGEKIEGLKDIVKFYFKYPAHTGEWRQENWTWYYNTGTGKADGKVKAVIGGQTILDVKTWQSDAAGLPGCCNVVCLQSDVSNATLPPGSVEMYRDIQIKVLK